MRAIEFLAVSLEHGAFRAVHWQWQQSGIEAVRQLWNQEYSGEHDFNEQPNQLLVDTVRGRKPGTALDVACGTGRNGLHLASQGWSVTGVDISDVGLKLAREQASQRKLHLALIEADLDGWDFGQQRWDLVVLVYAGPAMEPGMIRKIQASLKPGGLVVVEGFAPGPGISAPDATMGGQLTTLFGDGFEIVKSEIVEGTADWGFMKCKLVRFVARKR